MFVNCDEMNDEVTLEEKPIYCFIKRNTKECIPVGLLTDRSLTVCCSLDLVIRFALKGGLAGRTVCFKRVPESKTGLAYYCGDRGYFWLG